MNLPIVDISLPFQRLVGWGLIGLGAALMVYAIVAFWRFKTSVVPRQTPSALIDQGPYRISRNPIYLADLLILTGIVVLLGALSALVTLPLFWAAIQYRFILPEEEVLKETFGADYESLLPVSAPMGLAVLEIAPPWYSRARPAIIFQRASACTPHGLWWDCLPTPWRRKVCRSIFWATNMPWRWLTFPNAILCSFLRLVMLKPCAIWFQR